MYKLSKKQIGVENLFRNWNKLTENGAKKDAGWVRKTQLVDVIEYCIVNNVNISNLKENP